MQTFQFGQLLVGIWAIFDHFDPHFFYLTKNYYSKVIRTLTCQFSGKQTEIYTSKYSKAKITFVVTIDMIGIVHKIISLIGETI